MKQIPKIRWQVSSEPGRKGASILRVDAYRCEMYKFLMD